ncbi:unnamed protein product [Protopolystoma xenopodis]|uniref:Uncharacterized protein n=1 Tax=Protopolystoma xenopodis TaxID=117903 RepID=A0A3S5AY72_9PLAT|nr:unnamed protein product [Protopolystoma xenopodis]
MASQICLKKVRFLLLGHERGGLRCGALDHVTLETQSPRASLKHVVAVPAGLFGVESVCWKRSVCKSKILLSWWDWNEPLRPRESVELDKLLACLSNKVALDAVISVSSADELAFVADKSTNSPGSFACPLGIDMSTTDTTNLWSSRFNGGIMCYKRSVGSSPSNRRHRRGGGAMGTDVCAIVPRPPVCLCVCLVELTGGARDNATRRPNAAAAKSTMFGSTGQADKGNRSRGTFVGGCGGPVTTRGVKGGYEEEEEEEEEA